MKKLAVAVAALALSLPAVAQQQSQSQQHPQIGLGISVEPFAQLVVPTVELYLPINFGQLRLEPSLGLLTSDAPGDDRSNLTVGLGVFYLLPPASQIGMYAGGRVKIDFASVDNGVVDDSGASVVVAGALGGEYFLAPRFSLGLEGQLGFHSDTDVSGDASGFFTAGLAFLRLYFR
jgi:hypothetical protein